MIHIALTNSCCVDKPQRGYRLLRLLGLIRQRNALAQLDDRLLKDIGVTREQAQKEANRPLWDAPEAWHNQLY